jgi:hypothetical protein
MRNILEKVVMKIKTHFVFINFFPKIVPFLDNVESYVGARRHCMAQTHCMVYKQDYAHSHAHASGHSHRAQAGTHARTHTHTQM